MEQEELKKRFMEAYRQRQREAGEKPAEVEVELVEPVIVNPGKEERPNLGANNAYPREVREEFFRRVLDEGEHLSLVSREMGIARSTVTQWIAELKEQRLEQEELENLELADMFRDVTRQLLRALDKSKLEKASVRDLLIAAGIATDKRKDLLGPRKGAGTTRLRVAWRDGSGALEIES